MIPENHPALHPLLLFHGLSSSPQEFGLMAHALRSRGIAHHALQVPGYTLATGHSSVDWRDWRQAGLQAVGSVAAQAPAVVLGGLCMGGMLAAAVAQQMQASPQRVAGLVLMSPTFAYDGWGMSPVRHLRHLGYWTGLDRFFSVKEREPFGVKNEKIRKWIVRELQQREVSAAGPSRISLRALREADRMMKLARSYLEALDCPLLVIHARDDEITTLGSVQRVFDRLPQRDKQLAVLENSYHMISIDNDRQQVASLVADFVQRVSIRPVAEAVPGRLAPRPLRGAGFLPGGPTLIPT
ncbi:MAG: alpha/beta fold hydrolase [Herminiimonas sp.]|nr:alpha/beta fold hydrolase [Herminiimonas sp.]